MYKMLERVKEEGGAMNWPTMQIEMENARDVRRTGRARLRIVDQPYGLITSFMIWFTKCCIKFCFFMLMEGGKIEI